MPLKHSIWSTAPSGAALSKGSSTSPRALSLGCGQGLLGSITAQTPWALWAPLPSEVGALETWEYKGMEGKKSSLPSLLPKTPDRCQPAKLQPHHPETLARAALTASHKTHSNKFVSS